MQQRDTQPILIVEDSEDDFEATMRAFKRTNCATRSTGRLRDKRLSICWRPSVRGRV